MIEADAEIWGHIHRREGERQQAIQQLVAFQVRARAESEAQIAECKRQRALLRAPDEIGAAKRAYVDGDIEVDEFEARLDKLFKAFA